VVTQSCRRLFRTAIGLLLLGGRGIACLGVADASDQVQVGDQGETNGPVPKLKSPVPDQLETVIVTGTLLQGARSVTATPVTVITAQDLQARGFATVADALQQTSFATGSVDGPQFTSSFTPAAQTLSMFGMSPGYVKYLMDSRPMSDYPGLYNATDVITNLGGLPTALVDHIDVLPGGQSSLYGSDAIAGVINIILKKKLDAPIVDVRYGFYKEGGGVSKRIAVANGFKIGALNLLAGVQYEKTEPIWGFQRPLTASYYSGGTTPVTAETDYLVFGLSGTANGQFYFLDPKECAGASFEFGNTLRKSTQPGNGSYCGTTRSGFWTLNNGVEGSQGYLHGLYDLGEHLQLFTDVLLNSEITRSGDGIPAWYSSVDYGFYYDPNLMDLMRVHHIFAPEETGGLSSTMNTFLTDNYWASGGAYGSVPGGSWRYQLDLTSAAQRLINRRYVLLDGPVQSFFSTILGPNLGMDPIYGAYPTFKPNYAAFYQPVTPAQFASFSGRTASRYYTSANQLRVQLSNESLFALPGGPAGFAVAVEGADQAWKVLPDPRLFTGGIFGYVAVTGSGHRTRQALTSELQLPILKMLTLSASARYDNYRVEGENVGKATFTLSLEYRPFQALLLRGRYGTAFKAPTLADEFQGTTGFYSAVTDYYQCALGGYSGANIGNCPYYLTGYSGTTSGNPNLKPITAKLWDLGLVLSPWDRLSASIDYLHWGIRDEVNIQDADQVLKTESLCRLGPLDINSPTCVAALSQVTRDGAGQLAAVFTPKINISHETVDALTASISQQTHIGSLGTLAFEMSWSDLLKHTYQQYPNDPIIDLLGNPIWSTDFKSKANAAVTWSRDRWSSTVYVIRYGRSPNYLATLNGYGTPEAGTVGPWTLCNISARYQWTQALQLSFAADNVFNTMPPVDHSYPGDASQPYNIVNYNAYGRSYFFQASYTFRD
jgi:iron complex outermembrane receptor protein